MSRVLVFIVFVPLACSSPPPPATDPEQAREALRTVLDAWKQGEKPDAMPGRLPPIHASDSDWQAGWSLKSFEIAAGVEIIGRQCRFQAKLSLQSPQGKSVGKDVQYDVDTAPNVVIIRTFE